MGNIKSTIFTPVIFPYSRWRTLRVIYDGEKIWFVAKDISDILQVTSKRILDLLNDDEKSKANIRTNSGIQHMNVINRSGVDHLLMGLHTHRQERIQDFGRWMLDEVLPAMEKLPFLDCLSEDNESDTQEQELERPDNKDKSKVLFVNALMAADVLFSVQDLATILELNGYDIGGQIGLFEWFREHGYLFSVQGELYNRPTRTSIDMELFIVKKNIDYKPDGTTEITCTTMVTTEGMIYFINRFAEEAREK